MSVWSCLSIVVSWLTALHLHLKKGESKWKALHMPWEQISASAVCSSSSAVRKFLQTQQQHQQLWKRRMLFKMICHLECLAVGTHLSTAGHYYYYYCCCCIVCANYRRAIHFSINYHTHSGTYIYTVCLFLPGQTHTHTHTASVQLLIDIKFSSTANYKNFKN